MSGALVLGAVLAGVGGLVLGSIWAVLIERWPREVAIAWPRVTCVGCGARIFWREHLAVASWVAGRRRCPSCGRARPWYVPVIEMGTAALGSVTLLMGGVTGEAVAASVMVVALVPVVVIDIGHRLIPDSVVIPAAGVAITAMVVHDPDRWWVPVAGALGAAAFLLLLAVARPGGMGLGDVKLALLLGGALGGSVIPALAIAFVVGLGAGLVLLARRGRAPGAATIPFGPALAFGALVALMVGPELLTVSAAHLP